MVDYQGHKEFFCFGRASPSKLNLKLSFKIIVQNELTEKNNFKYNFKYNFKRSDQKIKNPPLALIINHPWPLLSKEGEYILFIRNCWKRT